jgi:lipopolysaccharide export system protein LptA
MNLPARLLATLALVLPAARLAAAGAPETVIDGDHFESRSTADETTSVFTGHVVVTGNDIRMTCDRLEVISLRTGQAADTFGKQDQFKYLLATGSVDIVQGDREATCGRAEILPRDNRITLTGNPVVVDHGNNSRCSGDRLTLLRGERRVLVEHAHMVGPPIKDLGFDKSMPPPPPMPAAKPAQP